MVAKANAPSGTFSTLYFATVREREGRDRLVAKNNLFQHYKAAETG